MGITVAGMGGDGDSSKKKRAGMNGDGVLVDFAGREWRHILVPVQLSRWEVREMSSSVCSPPDDIEEGSHLGGVQYSDVPQAHTEHAVIV